jgi:hypothetical protein
MAVLDQKEIDWELVASCFIDKPEAHCVHRWHTLTNYQNVTKTSRPRTKITWSAAV